MRIISGSLGGRLFDSPKGHRTHPMSEKMRGGLFSALGDIDGLSVLDAFSGSGALAFEAASRGATSVVALDTDPSAYNCIKSNIQLLGIDEIVKVTKAYAGAWSTRHSEQKFDIVLLDPPYNDIPFRDLKRMSRHVSVDGILVLSWPSQADWYPFEGLNLIQSRAYGDGTLHFYNRHYS